MIDLKRLDEAMAMLPPAIRRALVYESTIMADPCVPTAQISVSEINRAPVLRYNPRFVKTHCATPEKLVFLLAHEICHLLLGHLLRQISDVAADAIINAILYFVFGDPAYYSLVTDYYAPDQMPDAFLRPHSTIRHSLYKELYSAGLTSEERLDEELKRYEVRKGLLLCSHTESGQSTENVPWLYGIADYMFKNIANRGPGSGGSLFTEYLGAARTRWASRLNLVLSRFVNKPWINRLETKLADFRHPSSRSPVPSPYDRKGLFDVHCGVYHPFWESFEGGRSGGQTLVYWDVSASTDAYKADLLALLQRYKDIISEPLYQFSTELRPCSYSELVAGRIASTGGTAITPVLKHLVGGQEKCAVIITDGFYEPVSRALAPALKKKRILMVYTPSHKKEVMKDFAEVEVVLG